MTSFDSLRRPSVLVYAGLLCGLTMPAAQAQTSTTGKTPPPTPSLQWGPFTVNGDTWFRVEGRGHADYRNSIGNDPEYDYSRFRLGLRWKPTTGKTEPGRVSGIFVQPQVTYRNIGNAVPTTTNGSSERMELHQGYIELEGGNGRRWRFGRQELEYGESRLVAASGWSYPGRSFDAAKLLIARAGWKTDVFAGKLGQASNKINNPTLAGVYASRAFTPERSTDLYLLYKEDNVARNGIDVYTLGIRPKLRFGKGLEWGSEWMAQTGKNDGKDVRAYAAINSLSYTFPGSIAPRLLVEYDYASGGNPRDEKTYGTFDQLYPNNHYYYGIADVQGLRNMRDLRIGLRGKVAQKATITLDAHHFQLANTHDYWYAASGSANKGMNSKSLRDVTGAAGRDVGKEVDLLLAVPVKKNVNFLAQAARFTPGSFIRKMNSGNSSPSNWFCTQMSYTW